MLKSMTGFGRAALDRRLGQIELEIQTLNRKHLEVHLSIPSEFHRFESEIRRWIATVVQRGRVNVKIVSCYPEQSPVDIRPDIGLAKKIKEACSCICSELGIENHEPLLNSLLSQSKDILVCAEMADCENEYREMLRELFYRALEMVGESRLAEGEFLQKDIHDRLDTLSEHLEGITIAAPEQKHAYRKKLEEILCGLGANAVQDQDRIVQEVCLFAEKIDISEELTRLNSHRKQFLEQLAVEESVGKRLDFLVLEMLRECNTVAAKSVDVKIIYHVIEMKSELERIREQIQNVE